MDVEVCEEDAEINIEENEKEDGSPKLSESNYTNIIYWIHI